MQKENKIWRWYQRHNNAVDAVLDIACGAVPGANLVIVPMRLMLAKWKDQEELVMDEKSEEVEKVLSEVKPLLGEIVEEIEELASFSNAQNQEQRIVALKKNEEIQEEIQKIAPQLSQSIVVSVSRLQKRKILGSHYEVGDLLGKGGQAEVRKGRNLIADRLVAIKIFPKDLTEDTVAIEKLKQEYGLLVEKLVHESIVQYRDLTLDAESSRYFVVMDLVEGKNLRRKIMERGQRGFPLEETLGLLLPVARALDFAHSNGIVHKDLKPENIMIRESDQKIYLTDFGLASEIRSTLSRKPGFATDISGTLPYMAPEQYLGRRVDGRTDNWALGVILYEMVEGVHPFQGTTLEHYTMLVCEKEPETPERLDPREWQIVQSLLKKERKDRPENAQEILQSLRKGKTIEILPKSSQSKEQEEQEKKKREHAETLARLQKEIQEKEAALLKREQEIKEKERLAILAKQEEERKEEERKQKEHLAALAKQEEERRAEEIRKEKERLLSLAKKEAELKEKESQVFLAKTAKESYGLDSDLWKNCQYDHKGTTILDMASDRWVNQGFTKQVEYARAYQTGYARAKGLEIEKTISGIAMRLMPPGRFWMGSPDNEKQRESNEKRHRVIISKAFYVGKYEVTQAQWQAVMGKNPATFKNSGSNAPVEQVSWNDCQEFCKKTGFKLPTEAQWEYACRAGTTTPFNLGENMTPDQVNYNGNYPYAGGAKEEYSGKTVACGSLPNANAWGCYDFHGNVWEWCQDKYQEYSGDNISDPKYPNGSSCLLRGGSWVSNGYDCRSALRRSWEPDYQDSRIGLRCLCIP